MSRWIATNGTIEMSLCRSCGEPYRSGHINCSCDQNHPDPCSRPTYNELRRQVAYVVDEIDDSMEGQCPLCGGHAGGAPKGYCHLADLARMTR